MKVNENLIVTNIESKKNQNNYIGNSKTNKGNNPANSLKRISYSQLKDKVTCKNMIIDTKLGYWKDRNERLICKLRNEVMNLLSKPDSLNFRTNFRLSASVNIKDQHKGSLGALRKPTLSSNGNSNFNVIRDLNNFDKINNENNLKNSNNHNKFTDFNLQSTLSTIESTQTNPSSNPNRNFYESKLNKIKKIDKKLESYKTQFENLLKLVSKVK